MYMYVCMHDVCVCMDVTNLIETRFGAIFVKKMSHHSVRVCETSPISCSPAFTEQFYFAHQSQENAYLSISQM